MPFLTGMKDFKVILMILIFFSLIWFLYAVIFFIYTFFIKGRRLKKQFVRKDPISLHDIQELQALYEIAIKKEYEKRKKVLLN